MGDVVTSIEVERGSATVSEMAATADTGYASSQMTVQLPTGYLDGSGTLHKAVDIRPFTGEEEDILASPKMPMSRRLNKLLDNCVTKIGNLSEPQEIKQALRSMIFSDRLFLIVQVRIATNGPEYGMEKECPSEECSKKARYVLNLSDLTWNPIKTPERRQHVTKINGKAFSWNIMDGSREDKISEFPYETNTLSIGIYSRLNDIDGKKATMRDIKEMKPVDRTALRKAFSEQEGNVHDKVEFECEHCGHIWKDDVEFGQPSFFFPTGE